jgi:HSP20 family molecular chaperone IbpA
MKRRAKFRKAILRTVHRDSGETQREQIPLSDMSDCLLAVYDEVSRRAFQRCSVRGARQGSDREDWKAAEDDLFARIPVDFEESGGNLYALASLPGCAGTQITVAVDECWLLIYGDAGHNRKAHAADDFADCALEDRRADSEGKDAGAGAESTAADESYAPRDCDEQRESSTGQISERDHGYGVPSLPAPRPLCVVALRAKVDPGRSVAVLSNGLLAIRMGKAGLETPVPRVA